MVQPNRQDFPFSIDDFVARQVAQILRESRADARLDGGLGTIGHPPEATFVGETTSAVIKGITTHQLPKDLGQRISG